jgi:hypothetical protein
MAHSVPAIKELFPNEQTRSDTNNSIDKAVRDDAGRDARWVRPKQPPTRFG